MGATIRLNIDLDDDEYEFVVSSDAPVTAALHEAMSRALAALDAAKDPAAAEWGEPS